MATQVEVGDQLVGVNGDDCIGLVYVYVCMHACMYVCVYVCMCACVHVCMHVCMYCIHIHSYAYLGLFIGILGHIRDMSCIVTYST